MKKREVKELLKNSREDRFLTDKEGKFSNWKCLLFCFIIIVGTIVAVYALGWLAEKAMGNSFSFPGVIRGLLCSKNNIYAIILTILFFLSLVIEMYTGVKQGYDKRHKIESQVNKYYE